MTLSRRSVLASFAVSSMVSDVQGNSREAGPQVTVTVRAKKYCLGESGYISPEHHRRNAVTLRLTATAEYLNVGSRPLIIAMTHQISTIIVSQDSRLGQPGQFPIHLKRRQGPSDELPEDINFGDPFNALFKVIPSGGKTQFEEYAVVQVHVPSSPNPHTELLGKKVYLRLELAHWELSRRLVDDLRRKWRSYGELWAGQVISEPIELDIPFSPPIADCSHEYRID
jgi:hypothetical protein